jgi:serine/threonine protein kinase
MCSDCGTLGNLVAKLPAPSPEDDERVLKILLLLRDVAEGLKALHEAGVVHGDLVRGCKSWLCCVLDCYILSFLQMPKGARLRTMANPPGNHTHQSMF